ncbi:hypothetical protein BT93_B2462 [Corymbia citriodora subsp. variegata]|nr:hypothetical protein BT93_B2462 [Corymbia citriodora subsp. variegata]
MTIGQRMKLWEERESLLFLLPKSSSAGDAYYTPWFSHFLEYLFEQRNRKLLGAMMDGQIGLLRSLIFGPSWPAAFSRCQIYFPIFVACYGLDFGKLSKKVINLL